MAFGDISTDYHKHSLKTPKGNQKPQIEKDRQHNSKFKKDKEKRSTKHYIEN